jgi:hypothetical protein
LGTGRLLWLEVPTDLCSDVVAGVREDALTYTPTWTGTGMKELSPEGKRQVRKLKEGEGEGAFASGMSLEYEFKFLFWYFAVGMDICATACSS